MAKKVEILITAKNAVASGVKGAQKALKGFGGSAAAMGAKAAGAIAAVAIAAAGLASKLVSLSEKQTMAEIALANAHRLNGENAQSLVKRESALAGAIASETGNMKAGTTALMARLRMLGVQSASLGKATRATYALTAAGLGEAQASRAVMQAMAGDYSILQRLSPEIRNAKTETEKLAAFNKICEAGYATLTEQMTTFTGQTRRVKNEFTGLMSDIGKVINTGNWMGGITGRVADAIQAERRGLAYITRPRDTDADRLKEVNAELDELEARLYKGIDRSEAFWRQWRGASAGDKYKMLSRWNSRTEHGKVMDEAYDADFKATQQRLSELYAERAALIKKRKDAERAAAEAALKHAEEEGAKLQNIRHLYDRIREAKKQYYDIHEQEKAIAAKKAELEVERSLAEAARREAEAQKRSFEAQRDGLQAVLDLHRAILETNFRDFRANGRKAGEDEKNARRDERRNERALAQGKRIDWMVAHGMDEKRLSRSQREKLDYYRKTMAAREAGVAAVNTLAADAARGMGNREILAGLEQAIKDAEQNIAARAVESFDDSEVAREMADALEEMEGTLANMPSKEDVKAEIDAIEKALGEAKAGSEEWQNRQMELEKQQADNSSAMADILKTVEGLMRGQSEWLQKSLEGI